MEGYKIFHNGLCVSVFSAPNYCGDTRNLAAVIRFDRWSSMQPTVVQYAHAAAAAKSKGGQNAPIAVELDDLVKMEVVTNESSVDVIA